MLQEGDRMKNRIRGILKQLDELSQFIDGMDDEASLYDAGLSSFGAVELMVALESEFGIQFPDSFLTRETFENISSISAAVERLRQANETVAAGGRGELEIMSLGPVSAGRDGR